MGESRIDPPPTPALTSVKVGVFCVGRVRDSVIAIVRAIVRARDDQLTNRPTDTRSLLDKYIWYGIIYT
jgi:hypothetical protein